MLENVHRVYPYSVTFSVRDPAPMDFEFEEGLEISSVKDNV